MFAFVEVQIQPVRLCVAVISLVPADIEAVLSMWPIVVTFQS
jgi:hypothetical protein